MKILHILDHSLPIYDGYSFRSQNIFKAQMGAGLEPRVVTSPKHEADWHGEWAPEEMIEGVPHFRTGVTGNRAGPFVAEWLLMRALGRRIGQVAAQDPPAIIHAHSPVLNAFPATRAARKRSCPVIYEIRAFWEDAAADQGTYREGSLKYRIVRALETRCCARADAVVTICEGLRDELTGRGIPIGKIHVVPNAVVPVDFSEPEPNDFYRREWGLTDKLVVGFAGSFYHFEGLDLLLEAAARLAPEFPELAVLLVGSGEMAQRLKEQAAALGLENMVRFPGRVDHADVPGVYALIDVLAYPRKPMRLTNLVTPLKPLEAMAMGKALVASDVGGHRELIRDRDTGMLYRAGDVDSLCETLGELLRNPDLRRTLGRNGKEWVERERTWDRNGEGYRQLYETVLAGGSRDA